MKLDIAFVTQQNNQHRNDCGPACLSMVTGQTIDRILVDLGQPKNAPLHIQGIMSALRRYYVRHEHVRPFYLPDLRQWLLNGNPSIVLVRYGRLPAELKATDYGNHFVLVVGYLPDGGFYVHDPLWPGEAGAYRVWPESALAAAMAAPVDALQFQGVVVQRPFDVVEVSEADVLPMVREAVENTAVGYLEQLYEAMGITEGSRETRQGKALAAVTRWKNGAR